MKQSILSEYDLSCGKVQVRKWPYAKVELYKEFGTYHVRRFSEFVDGRLIQDSWLCFDNIKNARKAYKRQCEIVEVRS